MHQTMLKYPEVHTKIVFENIPTMKLELRSGTKRTIKKTADVTFVDNPEDGAHIGTLSDCIRKEKYLNNGRQL